MNIVVLMTGDSTPFKTAGYTQPKPLIDVMGKPLFQHVLDCMAPTQEHRWIIVSANKQVIPEVYTGLANDAIFISVPGYTEGDVCAALLAEGLINNDVPLMIIPEDQLITMKIDDFLNTVKDYDGGILTFPSDRMDCAYVSANEQGLALSTTEVPVTKEGNEHAIVGVYYFQRGRYFVEAAKLMISAGAKYNNQYPLASLYNVLISKGSKIRVVEIDANWTFSLRTPEQLAWYIGIMTNKPERELVWWRDHIAALGRDGFLAERKADWELFSAHLPELKTEAGMGLDLGCGPRSVLEFSGLTFAGQDPLMEYYKQLIDVPEGYVSEYPTAQFDWILFTNVIDHTPDPAGLVKYIYDRLKIGGRLYLEVNFDYALTAPHYTLWNMEMVRQYFGMFEVLKEHVETGRDPYRAYYWAVLKKN